MLNNRQQLKRGLPIGRVGVALALSLSIAAAAGYFMVAEQPADAVVHLQPIPASTVPMPERPSQPLPSIVKPTVPDLGVVRSAPPVEPDIHQDRRNLVSDAQRTGVLHISNVGDRIVVSREPRTPSAHASPSGDGDQHHAAGVSPAPTAPDESLTTGQETRMADYEDVYPGCPRTLPPGADEQMAQQRQALYGCQYLSSCEPASEESAASCTWYLVGKI